MPPNADPPDSAVPPAALRQRLAANLAAVRARVDAACARAARPAGAVRIVAVTKYVDAATIAALLQLGVRDVGESRVQQLAARAAALGADLASPFASDAPEPAVPRWHLIGHLQRNKVRALLRHARVVHSVDSERLARELNTAAAALPAPVDVFAELNVSGEDAKDGVTPADAPRLLETLARCPHLCLRGLMTMAPLAATPDTVRPVFARLREELAAARRAGRVPDTCAHLSMGMSGDFEVAVEEGATLVRVGSALFEGIANPETPA